MRIVLFGAFCGILLSLSWIGAASAQPESGGYAGTEACVECHQEAYESYRMNRHSIAADARTPGARSGCESCHGPGVDHAESEGENPIRSLKSGSGAPPDVISATCLQCHTKGKQALWQGSRHQSRNLSCSDCHSIHANNEVNLIEKRQETTCVKCHPDVRSQMLRQSRHPIREGKVKCADCHNAHGTIADNLIDAQTVNQKCFECHAHTRGPFLWEHPPAVEDCLTCHTPHGSARSGLLKSRAPYLCQRCHANVGHPSEVTARSSADARQSAYRVLSNRAFYRACLNCHVQIHGSNHPSGKSLVR